MVRLAFAGTAVMADCIVVYFAPDPDFPTTRTPAMVDRLAMSERLMPPVTTVSTNRRDPVAASRVMVRVWPEPGSIRTPSA